MAVGVEFGQPRAMNERKRVSPNAARYLQCVRVDQGKSNEYGSPRLSRRGLYSPFVVYCLREDDLSIDFSFLLVTFQRFRFFVFPLDSPPFTPRVSEKNSERNGGEIGQLSSVSISFSILMRCSSIRL